MAKNKISEWSSTPSNNTDVGGIDIAEGCAPSGINNGIREMMAQIKDMQSGSDGDNFTVGGNLAVTGTSAFTGDVTAPTQLSSDNSTKVATTAFVTTKVGTLGTMSSQNASAVAITGGTMTNVVAATLGEVATVSATAATSTINYDVLTQSVLYYTTNASGNWTLNVRGNSGTTLNSVMGVGEARTITFMVTNGSTAYYNSALTIDGTSVTAKWQGSVSPSSGTASAVDVYTYAIVKTASATFSVFASKTEFA